MANLLGPKRGTRDGIADGVETVLPGSPHTLFVQVEATRDERQGMHPIEYYISYEFDYSDIPACTSAGGVSAGAGATVTLPELPIYARVVDAYFDTLTAFVNDGGTEEIDAVKIGSTSLFADGDLTAAAGMVKAPEFSLAAVNTGTDPDAVTQKFPIKLAAATPVYVYFAGANTVEYTAGKAILWLKVISYLDK
jgi:hypothetical protein